MLDSISAAEQRPYRGRFAPTPSGPLHLGSLSTALAGYLDARHAGGRWLIRIDDLDAPRCRPEHADTILRQLEAHGLRWDEEVRYQSRHTAEYEAAFDQLRVDGLCYLCTCTRARLAETSHSGIDGPVYAGICSRAGHQGSGSWRLRMPDGVISLNDRLHGTISRDLQRDIGDFMIRRADGLIGYQLASVIDEREQRISALVRGADLIGSSLRQQYLLQHFGIPIPAYLHVPVLLDSSGLKLSKQNHALPIASKNAAQNLIRALTLLGQSAFAADWHGRIDEILRLAVRNWNPALIPRRLDLPA
ncbi:tRNA glutamyl-Q(34) synthetase GluQRS [uncultured Nevskia sp.]|uniref:tRNA glutamyl-Q(34) synthetase GluQRS n=1 Tax=uncultured Nevskia sp. TaxID=228950 RepID=UPI0025F40BFA|nr:tRNA glutamyl-Q(34) synthetase GluQRS [uncultured Nevskia sp.]